MSVPKGKPAWKQGLNLGVPVGLTPDGTDPPPSTPRASERGRGKRGAPKKAPVSPCWSTARTGTRTPGNGGTSPPCVAGGVDSAIPQSPSEWGRCWLLEKKGRLDSSTSTTMKALSTGDRVWSDIREEIGSPLGISGHCSAFFDRFGAKNGSGSKGPKIRGF